MLAIKISRFRLNQARILLLEAGYIGRTILVLQTFSTTVTRESELLQSEETIRLVNIGFGMTYTIEEFQNQADRNPYIVEKEVGDLHWKHREFSALIYDLDQVFGSEQRSEWVEMEKKRGLITVYSMS